VLSTKTPYVIIQRMIAQGTHFVSASRMSEMGPAKAEKLDASICFPLFNGGLNRSTQHFILRERWSVL